MKTAPRARLRQAHPPRGASKLGAALRLLASTAPRARLRPPRAQRGFTLLEMLVAAFVMAIVAALGWRGLDSVSRSRADIEAGMHAATQLQLAMQQMSADLGSAVDGGNQLGAVSLAGNGDLLIVRRVEQPLGADLRAWSADALPAQAGALQVVRWGLRDGSLLRWASAGAVSAGPLLQGMAAPAGRAIPMLDHVASMRVLVFRYAGTGLQRQSGAWVNPYTAADGKTGAGNPLLALLRTPAGLRLDLRLVGGSLRGPLEREFLLEARQ